MNMISSDRPLLADIAQIIQAGWSNGKSSTEIAEEILQELDEPAHAWLKAKKIGITNGHL
jgi:hypothetical protein